MFKILGSKGSCSGLRGVGVYSKVFRFRLRCFGLRSLKAFRAKNLSGQGL